MSSMRKKRKIKQRHARHAVMFRHAVKAAADVYIGQFQESIRKMGENFREHIREVMDKVKVVLATPSVREQLLQHFVGINRVDTQPVSSTTETAPSGAAPRGTGG